MHWKFEWVKRLIIVIKNLRWNCNNETADSVCNFNRHYAEHSGYFTETTFLSEENGEKEITFYDSVTGKPLYIAPRGRTWKEFVIESQAHGWPSFRSVGELKIPVHWTTSFLSKLLSGQHFKGIFLFKILVSKQRWLRDGIFGDF